ncbi:MAG TPA: response regulator, partial [Candidatus Ozemobacteraceae bacterium]|nr:response regulator [Candidatus Ozemobacteraceae bacterium]
QFAPDLPLIDGDPTQIRQVLMNLVINASEAIGDKSGIISVSTGVMHCVREYLAESYLDDNLTEGPYVFLEIADTGCGMTREIQQRIFEPFFTTKFQGRGLGMAAVLGIVRGHHGAIKIYSEAGKGTTFKVLFPAASNHLDRRMQRQMPSDWRGSGRVLFVDDEESVRAVGQLMLEKLGFTVVTAENGQDALDKYRADPESFQLIILDLIMPKMGGEEAFREFRRLHPAVRVLLSSGYNESEVLPLFQGKGLAGFIQKPYNLTRLSDVLKMLFPTAK